MNFFQYRFTTHILALLFIITASSCQATKKVVPATSSTLPPSQQTFNRVRINFNVDWKYFLGDSSNASDKDSNNSA